MNGFGRGGGRGGRGRGGGRGHQRVHVQQQDHGEAPSLRPDGGWNEVQAVEVPPQLEGVESDTPLLDRLARAPTDGVDASWFEPIDQGLTPMDAPRPTVPQPRPQSQGTLGISHRPGFGFDNLCLQASYGENTASLPSGLEPPERLGRDASRSEREEYARAEDQYMEDLALAREGADVGSLLDTIDGLYLPGDGNRNLTQTGATRKDAMMNEPRNDRDVRERATRDPFEQQLIRGAYLRGMPTLAVCGGSWRLAEAFGGGVETMPADQRASHLGKLNEKPHGIDTAPGALLGSVSANETPGHLDGVNSTHWSEVTTDRDGQLAQRDGLDEDEWPSGIPNDPSQVFDVTARSTDGAPEAFESRSGAPMLGVQWHPEAYLPNISARHQADTPTVHQSERMFDGFGQAMAAYRGRKQNVAEIGELVRTGRLRQA